MARDLVFTSNAHTLQPASSAINATVPWCAPMSTRLQPSALPSADLTVYVMWMLSVEATLASTGSSPFD